MSTSVFHLDNIFGKSNDRQKIVWSSFWLETLANILNILTLPQIRLFCSLLTYLLNWTYEITQFAFSFLQVTVLCFIYTDTVVYVKTVIF